MSQTQRFLLPFVAVLALAGIGLGVVAVMKDAPSTTTVNRQVKVLHLQLANDERQLANDGLKLSTLQTSSANADNVAKLQGSVAALQTKLAAYNVCIPQLQQEIGALNVNTQNTNGYLTDAYLQNQTIISSNCQKILYGQSIGR